MARRIPADRLVQGGCSWNGVTPDYINGIDSLIGQATTVVVCLGEFSGLIGEGVSTASLTLPEEQLQLLEAVYAIGRKTVVVLFNGRPLVLDRVLSHCDALLEAWYPGTMGGEAVAALLLGERNPSGKLVQTFPRHVGQVPIAYNARRTFARVNHSDLPTGPQFPFGYGLTYTSLHYDPPVVDRIEYMEGDTVRVSVRVHNTGHRPCREVVQLYLRDEVASVIPREKELRAYRVVPLEAGESRRVEFELPSDAFKLYDGRYRYVLEPGKFTLLTGSHSEALQGVDICFTR